MKQTEAFAGAGDGPWLTVVVPVLNEAESMRTWICSAGSAGAAGSSACQPP